MANIFDLSTTQARNDRTSGQSTEPTTTHNLDRGKVAPLSGDERRSIWKEQSEAGTTQTSSTSQASSITTSGRSFTTNSSATAGRREFDFQQEVNSHLTACKKKSLAELSSDEFYALVKQFVSSTTPEESLALHKQVLAGSEADALSVLNQEVSAMRQGRRAPSNGPLSKSTQGAPAEAEESLITHLSEAERLLKEQQEKTERQLKVAAMDIGGIERENVYLEEQKSLALGVVESVLFWRKSNNTLLSETQQANLERKAHLEKEIVRLEAAKKEQARLAEELKAAQEQITSITKAGTNPTQASEAVAKTQNLLSAIASATSQPGLKIVTADYMAKIRQIGNDAEALANTAGNAATVARVTRNVAIGTAATVATGGAALAMGSGVVAATGAVVVGTATGTTVGAVAQVAEQGVEIGMGNKDLDQAISDGLSETGQAAIISGTAALSVVGGGAAARAATGIGGRLLGSGVTSVASKILPQSGVIARVASTATSGMFSGGAYGAFSETLGTAQQITMQYIAFRSSEEAKGLSGTELAGAFMTHLEKQGITFSSVAKNTLQSTLAGAASGVVGSAAGAAREVIRSSTRQVGMYAAEGLADAGVGLVSAKIRAHREGRDLTFEEMSQEITAALISSSVGAATDKINRSVRKMSAEEAAFHDREANELGTKLTEQLAEQGLKKTVYDETYNKQVEQGVAPETAKLAANEAASKVTVETVRQEMARAGHESATGTLNDLKTQAGTDGLSKQVYEQTLNEGLAQGLSAEAAKTKAQAAALGHCEQVTYDAAKANTERVHDALFEKLRVTEQVEVLVRERLVQRIGQSSKDIAIELESLGIPKEQALAMAKEARRSYRNGARDQQITEIFTDGISKKLADYTIANGKQAFSQTFNKGMQDPQFKKVFMQDADRCGLSYDNFSKRMHDAALKGYEDGVHVSAKKAVRKGVENGLRRDRDSRGRRAEPDQEESEEIERLKIDEARQAEELETQEAADLYKIAAKEGDPFARRSYKQVRQVEVGEGQVVEVTDTFEDKNSDGVYERTSSVVAELRTEKKKDLLEDSPNIFAIPDPNSATKKLI